MSALLDMLPELDLDGDVVAEMWQLLEAEREAARRADAMALLTLQEMKRELMPMLVNVAADQRDAMATYARENLRRIRTLLSCYAGLLDVPKAMTYGSGGRLNR